MTKFKTQLLPEPLRKMSVVKLISLGLVRTVSSWTKSGQWVWSKEGCRAAKLDLESGGYVCAQTRERRGRRHGSQQEVNILSAQSHWKQPSVENKH